MHARMTHSLTIRYRARRRHACPRRRWKGSAGHYFRFFDWTSRGQLELMVVQSAVQWIADNAVRRRVCRSVDGERWPDRPLIARDKLTCYEWLCPRLSGATGAQRGRSLASEADTASTLVVWVAAGCSAARLLRYFGSRQKFSFFRLSGAATRRM